MSAFAGKMAFVLSLLLALSLRAEAAGDEGVAFGQPGFPNSRLDGAGRLVEDWGALKITLQGKDVPAEGKTTVQKVLLDGVIPAASARTEYGPVTLILTAFRGPAWPAGTDVLIAKVQETSKRGRKVSLVLGLPDKAQGQTSVAMLGGKAVIRLPDEITRKRTEREWGCSSDAGALPGWAKPAVLCDPAFKNIRAGMGGVPIIYRFPIEKNGHAQVVLGFCESHWQMAGQRPLICAVEGAARQEVDPIAKWGRHNPGALVFDASDENGDGRLDIAVLGKPGSKDLNPILNVIWTFQPGLKLNLDEVIAGQFNAAALRYVDVGGERDQSLYVQGPLEYELDLPASGAQEIGFMVACKGATAPTPERSAWTPEGLRKAAKEVWDEWFLEHMPAKLPDGVTREARMLALVDAELARNDAPAEAHPPRPQR
jgi:hypothetical protein